MYRILELKNKLGLPENPYKDAYEQEEKEVILCREHRELARETARKSFVLLKNEDILPLHKEKMTAAKSVSQTWQRFVFDFVCQQDKGLLCPGITPYPQSCRFSGSRSG